MPLSPGGNLLGAASTLVAACRARLLGGRCDVLHTCFRLLAYIVERVLKRGKRYAICAGVGSEVATPGAHFRALTRDFRAETKLLRAGMGC